MSMGKKKFSADYQLMFRLLKLFLFIGFIVALFFLFLNLTVGDIFVSLLAFMPTGWALLSVCSLSLLLSVAIYPFFSFLFLFVPLLLVHGCTLKFGISHTSLLAKVMSNHPYFCYI